MIVGTGVDIAEVSRIEAAIRRRGRRLLERVFTPAEIRYCESRRNKFERYAARFAAKEAAMKALGTGWRRGIRWRDIEISNLASGQPTLAFSGLAAERARKLGAQRISLSLSHAKDLVIAQVILES